MGAKGVTDDELKKNFDEADTDGSGEVSTTEMKAIFVKCGVDEGEAEEIANVSNILTNEFIVPWEMRLS